MSWIVPFEYRNSEMKFQENRDGTLGISVESVSSFVFMKLDDGEVARLVRELKRYLEKKEEMER